MQLPCGVYNDTYENDMAIVRTTFQKVILVAFLVFLMILPLVLESRTLLKLIIWISIWTIVGLGIGLLTGYCGQVSLGHAAFVAVGAYTSVVLIKDLHFPFLLTFPIAI